MKTTMEFSVILSFLAVALVLTLMPGPDILFVTAQSISQNKQAGIFTTLGLCTGLFVHIAAATFGISAIIYKSSVAFTVVKYAGALYLLYLAWQSFRAKEAVFKVDEQRKQAYFSLYKRGIIMNLLNPKVSLFFIALLPQFVNESSGFVPLQMLTLGVIFLIQALLVFFAVSFFAEKMGKLLASSQFLKTRLNKIQALIFAAISFQIVFSD